eukprot:comp22739_c1_seq1/m.35454 comp22739_c1_seq1/g.35454  ORF comp22739_c1_seq1/g.35454 comp22739_c1_seq1/m.35454 type:complete len:494 (-) comp22739_c1_seq1:502-1983(-)
MAHTLRRLCRASNLLSTTRGLAAARRCLPTVGTVLQRNYSSSVLGQPNPIEHPHLMKDGEVTPGTTLREYQKRRKALMDSLPEHSLVVVPGHPLMFMSADIPYPFRQHSDFSYLCGFQEPDGLLLLKSTTKDADPQVVMVVPPKDPHSELWNGPRSGVEGAVAFFGANEAQPTDRLKQTVVRLLESRPNVFYDGHIAPHQDFHKTIMAALAETQRGFNPLQRHMFAMRVIKSQSEMDIMRKAGKISSRAFIKAMKSTHPGQTEHQINNILEYSARMEGCKRLAYPPVVAGGPRGLTLHYISNDQVLKSGDLLLVDAGCELYDYASDITRTWPVSGKFTQAQAEVYEAVLTTNKQCIEACQANDSMSLDNLHSLSVSLLATELRKLGAIPTRYTDAETRRIINRWYPHHVGHYLGMDTHDTMGLSRQQPLRPGMVITIEPGLYFQEDDEMAPERYRGIGIRIEDDVHITPTGPEVLTSDCPKDISAIESLMAAA